MTRSMVFWPTRRHVPMLKERHVKLWITANVKPCYSEGTGFYIPTFPGLVGSARNIISPLPYAAMGPAEGPRKLLPICLPDSRAFMARYWRIDSGIASQSSPFSMLFLERSFIFARLRLPGSVIEPIHREYSTTLTCSGTIFAQTAPSCLCPGQCVRELQQ